MQRTEGGRGGNTGDRDEMRRGRERKKMYDVTKGETVCPLEDIACNMMHLDDENKQFSYYVWAIFFL